MIAFGTLPNLTVAQTDSPQLTHAVHKTYTRADILEIVYKEIKGGSYNAEKLSLSPKSSFTKDIGFDSLDVIEFIMNMETAFDITIPDPALEKVHTIQDAVIAIDGVLKQQR